LRSRSVAPDRANAQQTYGFEIARRIAYTLQQGGYKLRPDDIIVGASETQWKPIETGMRRVQKCATVTCSALTAEERMNKVEIYWLFVAPIALALIIVGLALIMERQNVRQ
jgi:hypothetical protein